MPNQSNGYTSTGPGLDQSNPPQAGSSITQAGNPPKDLEERITYLNKLVAALIIHLGKDSIVEIPLSMVENAPPMFAEHRNDFGTMRLFGGEAALAYVQSKRTVEDLEIVQTGDVELNG